MALLPPQPTARERQHERAQAKERVVRAFREGRDWKTVAASNDVTNWSARRAIIRAGSPPTQRGGVRQGRIKLTVEVMAKLEEYVEEDCRFTCQEMRDRLQSEMGVAISRASVHRALQDMVYSIKKLRIEKVTMNNSTNKAMLASFVEELNKHHSNGDMIIYQDETNFNMYLSRTERWSRVGERAVAALPPSQGKNLHVQGGVSVDSGIVLLNTHVGSIRKEENARFVADLFMATLRSDAYQELDLPTRSLS